MGRWGTEHLSATERFWLKVNMSGPIMHGMDTPCWVWTAGTQKWNGYGVFKLNGKGESAHRVAWFLAHGKWPKHYALHKCDNPPCVRLDHLFEGNDADNMEDMYDKGRAAMGEKQYNTKLTEKQVRRIRNLKAQGLSYSTLAQEFGVCQTTLRQVVHRQRWRHVL
jgi:HNH endonuclease